MNAAPPIPPNLMAELRAFLAERVSGNAVMHIHKGRVTRLELTRLVLPCEGIATSLLTHTE